MNDKVLIHSIMSPRITTFVAAFPLEFAVPQSNHRRLKRKKAVKRQTNMTEKSDKQAKHTKNRANRQKERHVARISKNKW